MLVFVVDIFHGCNCIGSILCGYGYATFNNISVISWK